MRGQPEKSLDLARASLDEILNRAYQAGYASYQRGEEAEPFTFLLWLTNFMVLNEASCRNIMMAYQAGYASERRRR
jgi:hypothetical protein